MASKKTTRKKPKTYRIYRTMKGTRPSDKRTGGCNGVKYESNPRRK